jgi:hypothetical protein
MPGQLSVLSEQNGIPKSIPGQVVHPAAVPFKPLERWHSALAAQVAGELKGHAADLRTSDKSSDQQLAETQAQRALLWMQLSKQIYRATCGELAIFRAGDVELVRFFRLVQLRLLEKSSTVRSARCRQLDNLFGALYAALIPIERSRVDAELAP